MQLSRVGITHLRHKFALGGRLRVRCEDWRVTEFDQTGTLAVITPNAPFPATIAPVEEDRTEDLVDALIQGYESPEPSSLPPGWISAIEAFSTAPLTERTSLELGSIAFDSSVTDADLRRLRGRLLRLMAPCLGAARVKLSKGSYKFSVSRNPLFTGKLLTLGLGKSEVQKLLLFSNAGFSKRSVSLELQAVADSAGIQESIAQWDPEIAFSRASMAPGPQETADELTLSWRPASQTTTLGIYNTPQWRCVLSKKNLDLPSLLTKAEKKLGLPRAAIGFAGIKDKRGVTSQFLTVPMIRTGAEISTAFQSLGADIGSFEPYWSRKKLRQGELGGNCFDICLRGVTADENAVSQALAELNSPGFGFTNYFGLQRFGFALSDGSSKHVLVGTSMLRRDWQSAVHTLLSTDTFMWRFIDQAKLADFDKYIEAGDYAGAARVGRSFPQDAGYMRMKILDELLRGGSYKDALRLAVPKTLLHLLPASVVSLLWNAKASLIASSGDSVAGAAFAAEPLVLEQLGAETPEPERFSQYATVAEQFGLLDVLHRDLDLSDDLGFICRMTRVRRPVTVRPGAMRADRLDEGGEDRAGKSSLRLQFTLPAGSYASALLLELMEGG